MNSKLIEAGENCYFFCNNCKSKFTFIYTFLPTNNSIMEKKNKLNTNRLNPNRFNIFNNDN